MLVVRGGAHADEGAKTSARNQNPEREKAGITLRSTEHQLALAETCANKASVAREKKREEASVARERLRNAELLYVQGCNTLERLADEYGETRLEVEIALAHAESELIEKNDLCNRLLRELKMAEDITDAALLSLRQAEMDHESAVQRLARMFGNVRYSRELDNGEGATAVPGTPKKSQAVRALRAAPPTDAACSTTSSVARAELAALGIIVDSDAAQNVHSDATLTEALCESLLEAARKARSDGVTPSKGGAIAAHNLSTRVIGFGRAPAVLGHPESTCLSSPTDLRAVLQAIKVGTPVSIACSEKHALLVTDNGEVLAWGEDGSGRLGGGGGGGGGGGRGGADEALQRQNEHVSVPLPRPVRGLQGVTVMKVACSSHHSLALSTDGDLYAWGSALNGVLGVSEHVTAKMPTDLAANAPYSSRAVKVEGFNGPLIKERVRDMSCGPTFNVACTVGGLTYAWGSSWGGCLGMGVTEGKGGLNIVVATPSLIEALRGQKMAQVACGQSHVLGLTDSSAVWAWGSAAFGKLGLGDVSRLPTDGQGLIHAPLPMHVEDLLRKHVVQVAAGATHSLAVTRDGLVYAWGSCANGQLGLEPLSSAAETDGDGGAGALMLGYAKTWWPFCPSPTAVNGLRGRPISKVACGEVHSVAATIDGEVLVWGLASDGRLGIGVGVAEELGADDAKRESHDAYRDAYREHLSGTLDGKGLQANFPVSVEDMPWGHVQIAVASSYSLLLYNTLDSTHGNAALGGGMTPEIVPHLESMFDSSELADVVLVCKDGAEVRGHAVVLLSVPYLCTAIRELRHKRMDDSELMTVQLAECHADALRCALRYAYSGVYESPACEGRSTPETVRVTLDLLHCAATLLMVPLLRACARTLEAVLSPETVAEVWEASHLHDLPRLKTKCLRFIIDNYESCRPEKEPSIRDAMRKHQAFFDLIMSALAPGPAAHSRATKLKCSSNL